MKFIGSAMALAIAGLLFVAAPTQALAQYDDGGYGIYNDASDGGAYGYGDSYGIYNDAGYDSGYSDYSSGYGGGSYATYDGYSSDQGFSSGSYSPYSPGFGGDVGYGSDYGSYGSSGCGGSCGGSYGTSYGGSYGGCGSCSTPVYNYNQLPPSPQPNSSLGATCYPEPLSAQIGQTVQWVASAYGGNNSYNYSWTGTDGLSGIGSRVSKSYSTAGNKNATVTVRSGGQTVSRNCDMTATVYGNQTPPPVYVPPPVYRTPLSVSCSSSVSSGQIGTTVTWNAYVSGGRGYYSYNWTGTDGLSGSSAYIYKNYVTPGTKYASVTVQSDGQILTQGCNNSVVIQQPYIPPVYQTPIVVRPVAKGLDIGCYADPNTVSLNQPTSWISEVSGGVAPYTYEWTGSDNITGNSPSIIKYYSTAGEKNAIVTVRSANGLSGTRTCSTTVKVKSAAVAKAPVKPVVKPKPDCGCSVTSASAQPLVQQPVNTLSAASVFSLTNIPWGWVAILVILVLFATVMYLIFNRQKI